MQLTLPDIRESFAIIHSIEKGGVDKNGRVGTQLMGPGDGYIAQTVADSNLFWADRNSLSLGACFKPTAARKFGDVPRTAVSEVRSTQRNSHRHQALSGAAHRLFFACRCLRPAALYRFGGARADPVSYLKRTSTNMSSVIGNGSV